MDVLDDFVSAWAELAADLAAGAGKEASLAPAEAAARKAVEAVAFLRCCLDCAVVGREELEPLLSGRTAADRLARLVESWDARFGPGLFACGVAGEEGPLPGQGFDWLARASPLVDLLKPSAGGTIRPDDLGRLHERLLGRRLAVQRGGGHRAVPSTAARKRSGVVYTPECVTQYIVEQAIHSPDVLVVDPACGCGAFLLAACRRLREGRGTADCDRLFTAERLFGVDLDPEAVLVARRAVWIEMLSAAAGSGDPRRTGSGDPRRTGSGDPRRTGSGDPRRTGSGDPRRTGSGDPRRTELAAALCQRIVCGDALTGPALAALEGRADIVLGNPPYRRELDSKDLLDRVAATQFGRRWRTARMDLWYYFVHRGLDLLKPGGVLSFVVNSYWTSGRGAEKLVGQLRESATIEELFLLDDLPVFSGVSGRHMVLRVRKSREAGPTTVKRPGRGDQPSPPAPLPQAGEGSLSAPLPTPHAPRPTPHAPRPTPHAPRPTPHAPRSTPLEDLLAGRAPLAVFCKTPEQLFRGGRLDLEPPCDELLARLGAFPPLGQLGQVRQGIVENPAQVTRKMNDRHGGRWRVGEGVFALTDEEVGALGLSDRERAVLRPYHDLGDLGRNRLAERPSRWLIYSTPATCPDIDALPALREHLARFRPILEARREVRLGRRAWWHLHWPREEAIWRAAKVIALQMARRPSFVAATGPVYVPFSANVFVPGPERREHVAYFAAVLNSRPLETWFRHHAKRRGVGLEINGGVLARAPVRPIDFADPADRARHERIVELAPGSCDDEVDQLVCELFGLGNRPCGQ